MANNKNFIEKESLQTLVNQVNENTQNISKGKDWNQNDATKADFIKNRTHYEEDNSYIVDSEWFSLEFSDATDPYSRKIIITLPTALKPETEYGIYCGSWDTENIPITTDDNGNVAPIGVYGSTVIEDPEGSWVELCDYSVYVSIVKNKLIIDYQTVDNRGNPVEFTDRIMAAIRELEVGGDYISLYGLFIKQLDHRYIPIDYETITTDDNGNLRSNYINTTYTLSKQGNHIILTDSDGKVNSVMDSDTTSSNWSQNNSSAVDYIQNRTHYEYDGCIINVYPGYDVETGEFVELTHTLPRALKPNTEYRFESDNISFEGTVVTDANGNIESTDVGGEEVYDEDTGNTLGYYTMTFSVSENELTIEFKITKENDSVDEDTIKQAIYMRDFSLDGPTVKQLDIQYIPLPLHAGDGETSLVQNDGSEYIQDDGKSNYTNATHAVVFGNNNRIIEHNDSQDGKNSFIAGGLGNLIYSGNSFIGGGDYNTVGSTTKTTSRSAIIGGTEQLIDAYHGFIGGGRNNTIKDNYSGVIGGHTNTINSTHSFVGGGQNNIININGINAFIGGGQNNTVNNINAFASGIGNNSNGKYAATFGNSNTANGPGNFIGGGYKHTVSGDHGATLGGNTNEVSGNRSVIAGGTYNKLTGVDSFIGGGKGLKSETDYQVLFGKYNDYDTGATLIIGGGTKSTPKNIYTLRASGTPSIDTDLTTKHYVDNKFANVATQTYVDNKISNLSIVTNVATNTTNGLMSSTDKKKLDSIGEVVSNNQGVLENSRMYASQYITIGSGASTAEGAGNGAYMDGESGTILLKTWGNDCNGWLYFRLDGYGFSISRDGASANGSALFRVYINSSGAAEMYINNDYVDPSKC